MNLEMLKQQFDQNSYVVLQNVFSKQQCLNLSNYMFDLYAQNKLTKDDQCPMSDSFHSDNYSDGAVDIVIDPLAKIIENILHVPLLHTYTYARIYRPGETLKRHRDRPACEISATLTLNYDSEDIWPIFFKETPVTLNIGDLAIYKGCDIEHWRPAFTGNWHVQMFIHYISASGPYKDLVKKYYSIKKSKR